MKEHSGQIVKVYCTIKDLLKIVRSMPQQVVALVLLVAMSATANPPSSAELADITGIELSAEDLSFLNVSPEDLDDVDMTFAAYRESIKAQKEALENVEIGFESHSHRQTSQRSRCILQTPQYCCFLLQTLIASSTLVKLLSLRGSQIGLPLVEVLFTFKVWFLPAVFGGFETMSPLILQTYDNLARLYANVSNVVVAAIDVDAQIDLRDHFDGMGLPALLLFSNTSKPGDKGEQ